MAVSPPSQTPPSPPPAARPPESSEADLRQAANRRIFYTLFLFIILLGGALYLFFSEEHRRTRIIPPEAPPAAAPIDTPPPVTAPALPMPVVPAPTGGSPALEQSLQMEQALTALREANDYLKTKRFDLAEKRATDALSIHPNMASAQRILGLVYLQQGRFQKSIAAFEESLRNEPLHPDALSNLAFAYFQIKNVPLALELIETCRRLYPDYEYALLQEGLIKMAIDSEQAIETLREAVEAFPDRPSPRNNLAVALIRAGDFQGAREQLDRLLQIDPGSFTARFNIAAIYAKQTNAVDAVTWLRQAMNRVPPDQFRNYLTDPDFLPIRTAPEFTDFLKELDPDLPPPPPRTSH